MDTQLGYNILLHITPLGTRNRIFRPQKLTTTPYVYRVFWDIGITHITPMQNVRYGLSLIFVF